MALKKEFKRKSILILLNKKTINQAIVELGKQCRIMI